MDPAHRQVGSQVRFDWGPTGADAVVPGAAYAVVVDVLSFTTTLSVAVERGSTVYPYRWRDEGAAAFAEARDATLAVGRFEARGVGADAGTAVSLSPAQLLAARTLPPRIVLPSPNGSAISFRLAASGATVVGACLRNASAVAGWLAGRLADEPGAEVAVIAAGERWPDGSLRPAVEDLWGAGAVLSGLSGSAGRGVVGVSGFSPEARAAAAAFDVVRERLAAELRACAGARELAGLGPGEGFGADVEVAADLDCSAVVPVLRGEAFGPG